MQSHFYGAYGFGGISSGMSRVVYWETVLKLNLSHANSGASYKRGIPNTYDHLGSVGVSQGYPPETTIRKWMSFSWKIFYDDHRLDLPSKTSVLSNNENSESLFVRS